MRLGSRIDGSRLNCVAIARYEPRAKHFGYRCVTNEGGQRQQILVRLGFTTGSDVVTERGAPHYCAQNDEGLVVD